LRTIALEAPTEAPITGRDPPHPASIAAATQLLNA
jgi:hypothetical protein